MVCLCGSGNQAAFIHHSSNFIHFHYEMRLLISNFAHIFCEKWSINQPFATFFQQNMSIRCSILVTNTVQ